MPLCAAGSWPQAAGADSAERHSTRPPTPAKAPGEACSVGRPACAAPRRHTFAPVGQRGRGEQSGTAWLFRRRWFTGRLDSHPRRRGRSRTQQLAAARKPICGNTRPHRARSAPLAAATKPARCLEPAWAGLYAERRLTRFRPGRWPARVAQLQVAWSPLESSLWGAGAAAPFRTTQTSTGRGRAAAQACRRAPGAAPASHCLPLQHSRGDCCYQSTAVSRTPCALRALMMPVSRGAHDLSGGATS